jgi:hypothetical protein
MRERKITAMNFFIMLYSLHKFNLRYPFAGSPISYERFYQGHENVLNICKISGVYGLSLVNIEYKAFIMITYLDQTTC